MVNSKQNWQLDPQTLECPEEFRSERFVDNKQVDFWGRHFRLVLFGSGGRVCHGINFTMSSLKKKKEKKITMSMMKIATVNLVGRFEVDMGLPVIIT